MPEVLLKISPDVSAMGCVLGDKTQDGKGMESRNQSRE